jgi:hypothetical protein
MPIPRAHFYARLDREGSQTAGDVAVDDLCHLCFHKDANFPDCSVSYGRGSFLKSLWKQLTRVGIVAKSCETGQSETGFPAVLVLHNPLSGRNIEGFQVR